MQGDINKGLHHSLCAYIEGALSVVADYVLILPNVLFLNGHLLSYP